MKKYLVLWLTMIITITVFNFTPEFQLTVNAALADLPTKERNLTDEEFLGIWDEATMQWTVPSKINYSYSPKLAPVEEAVKAGNYNIATEKLFSYYKETGRKFLYPSTQRSTENNSAIMLMSENIFARGSLMASATITNEEKWHEFDVTTPLKSKLSSNVKQVSYTFMGRNKGDATATFQSKESGVNQPVLVVSIDGVEKTYPVTADTYIRAGENANKTYGFESVLQVKESGMPVDDNNMRMYLQFDFPDLNAKSRIAYAFIKVYGSTDDVVPMPILMFNSEQLVIDEANQSWSNTGLFFYSWKDNGTVGPTQWVAPQGSGYDYMARLYRFWNSMSILGVFENATSDKEYYAQMLIELTRNFYNNFGAGGLLIDKSLRPSDTNLAAGQRLQMTVDMYLSLLKGSATFNDKDSLMFIKLIYDDIDFLNLKECFWGHHAIGNNWGSQGNLGIACGLAYFPEFDKNEEWLDELSKRVQYQLDTLILGDGTYVESTNSYSTGVFSDFASYKGLMAYIGYPIPSTLDSQLKRFAYSFVNMMEPNLYLTEYGDDSYDYSEELLENIEKMADAYGDPYLKYIGSGYEKGEAPAYTSVDYPNGRFSIMRSGWGINDLFSFFITRPYGTHSHNHGLNMTLYAYGRRLLADTSQRSYDNETISNWQRLRRVSHNVIEVDDSTVYKGWTDNTNLIKGDSENTIAPSYDIMDGYHKEMKTSSGEEYVQMNRRITFLKPLKFWVVSDSVDTKDNVPTMHKYNQTWHMEPKANPSMAVSGTKRFLSNYETGANLQIIPADKDEIIGQIATDGFLGTNNHKYASYVKQSEGDVTFDTVLFPTMQGSDETAWVDRIETGVPTTTASAMKVTIKDGNGLLNQGYYYTSYEQLPQERVFDGHATNAKIAYINTDKNDTLTFALIKDGNKISRNGVDIISSGSAISDLSVEWLTKELKISSSVALASQLGSVSIYAPNPQAIVTFNGKQVNYTKDGNTITINPAEEKIIVSENVSSIEKFQKNLVISTGVSNTTVKVSNENKNALQSSQPLPRDFVVTQRENNLAFGIIPVVQANPNDAVNMTDGRTITSWKADNANYPQVIDIDLGGTYEVSDIQIVWDNHPTNLGQFKYKLAVGDYTTQEKEAFSVSTDSIRESGSSVRLTILENSFLEPAGIKELIVNTVGKVVAADEWKNVISVGRADMSLQNPIRLQFTGLANKKIGMVDSNGAITEITQKMTGDTAADLGTNSIARLTAGDDAIIWTRQLGDFIAYGIATVDEGEGLDNYEGGGRPGGGGGGASPIPIPTEPMPEIPPIDETIIRFEDIDNHWAKDTIIKMVKKNVIKGVTETAFEPDRNITRAEFTALIMRAFAYEQADYQGSFADVTQDVWFAKDVQAAFNLGLINGSNGAFRPNDEIVREEAIKILVCAIEKSHNISAVSEVTFMDKQSISAWALPFIQKAEAAGLIQGDEEGNVSPKKTTTRAEAAVMISRAIMEDSND